MINVTFAGYGSPYERCAFCRIETDYWYQPNDVAVCHICAKFANPEDVPTKKDWVRKEEIVNQSILLYEEEELDKLMNEIKTEIDKDKHGILEK